MTAARPPKSPPQAPLARESSRARQARRLFPALALSIAVGAAVVAYVTRSPRAALAVVIPGALFGLLVAALARPHCPHCGAPLGARPADAPCPRCGQR